MCLTYPLMGNYGVPAYEEDELGLFKYFESDCIHVQGLIVQDYTPNYHHWQATRSLGEWLNEEGIPALYDIDTRALAQKLRSRGTMAGKIVFDSDIAIHDPVMGDNLVAVEI